jgi:hypothetical protein
MSAAHLALFAWLLVAPQAPAAQPVNRDAQTQKAFADRVTKYVELRKSVEAKLSSLPDKAEPNVITQHQRALLAGLQRARSNARPGDLFDENTRHLIRRLIAGALKQRGMARQAMREENPGQLPVRVNGAFPTTVPLPTVPPQVLLALPRLPDEELEYRFIGTRLLLLDSRANMVVDYMDRALPK